MKPNFMATLNYKNGVLQYNLKPNAWILFNFSGNVSIFVNKHRLNFPGGHADHQEFKATLK